MFIECFRTNLMRFQESSCPICNALFFRAWFTSKVGLNPLTRILRRPRILVHLQRLRVIWPFVILMAPFFQCRKTPPIIPLPFAAFSPDSQAFISGLWVHFWLWWLRQVHRWPEFVIKRECAKIELSGLNARIHQRHFIKRWRWIGLNQGSASHSRRRVSNQMRKKRHHVVAQYTQRLTFHFLRVLTRVQWASLAFVFETHFTMGFVANSSETLLSMLACIHACILVSTSDSKKELSFFVKL